MSCIVTIDFVIFLLAKPQRVIRINDLMSQAGQHLVETYDLRTVLIYVLIQLFCMKTGCFVPPSHIASAYENVVTVRSLGMRAHTRACARTHAEDSAVCTRAL